MFPFDPPEYIRKPSIFWCFQGGQKGTLERNGLNWRPRRRSWKASIEWRADMTSKPLTRRSRYWDSMKVWLRHILFQMTMSLFAYVATFSSGYLLKIDNSLGQLLFWRMNLFRIKISIAELPFRSRYFLAATINFFASSYFFNKADSSEKEPFKISYFFRDAFRKQLIFQKSNITQLAFSEEILLHSYKLPFHSYTSLWLVTYGGDSVWVLSCVTNYSQTLSHNRYLTRYLFAIVWLISRLHELLWNDYLFRASTFYGEIFFTRATFLQ